jgi:hypothetical protein
MSKFSGNAMTILNNKILVLASPRQRKINFVENTGNKATNKNSRYEFNAIPVLIG